MRIRKRDKLILLYAAFSVFMLGWVSMDYIDVGFRLDTEVSEWEPLTEPVARYMQNVCIIASSDMPTDMMPPGLRADVEAMRENMSDAELYEMRKVLERFPSHEPDPYVYDDWI